MSKQVNSQEMQDVLNIKTAEIEEQIQQNIDTLSEDIKKLEKEIEDNRSLLISYGVGTLRPAAGSMQKAAKSLGHESVNFLIEEYSDGNRNPAIMIGMPRGQILDQGFNSVQEALEEEFYEPRRIGLDPDDGRVYGVYPNVRIIALSSSEGGENFVANKKVDLSKTEDFKKALDETKQALQKKSEAVEEKEQWEQKMEEIPKVERQLRARLSEKSLQQTEAGQALLEDIDTMEIPAAKRLLEE